MFVIGFLIIYFETFENGNSFDKFSKRKIIKTANKKYNTVDIEILCHYGINIYYFITILTYYVIMILTKIERLILIRMAFLVICFDTLL